MKLISLSLRNFKGARELTITPDGQNLAVYGDNATGKTTIADAWFWLLFGKDSRNRKDFDIKTLDESNRPIKGLEHEVHGVVELEKGEVISLTRTYKEKWVKSRGPASQPEFSGHTTDYKVNGVPVPEAEYLRWISGICEEKRFRLLTDTNYANEVLKWEELRRILIEVCGDITDADVIASSDKLSGLPAILGNHSLADYRKILDARRKAANEQISQLPTRIDELRRKNLEDEPVPGDAENLRSELKKLNEQRARLEAGGEVAELTKRIREIEGEIIALTNQAAQGAADSKQAQQAKIREAQTRVANIEATMNRIKFELDLDQQALSGLEPKRLALLEEFRLEKAKTFSFDASSGTCGSCGQTLPEEQIFAARANAEEIFNLAKATALESNMKSGTELKELIGKFNAKIETKQGDIAAQEAALRSAKDDLATLEAESVVPAGPMVMTEPAAVSAKRTEIVSLGAKIDALKQGSSEALATIDTSCRAIQSQLALIVEAEVRNTARRQDRERVTQLEQEERKLAAEIEKIDSEIFLGEEFIRVKVKALESKINARFGMAKFRLFKTQINGAVLETCETLYGGVPFNSLNNGSRVNVGLDIIDTLSAHYGFAPPIFIDNAESVTSIRPTRGQQIQLVVSKADQALRTETRANAQEALV